MPQLTVLEYGKPITYSFADLLKYHGMGFPGGVAQAFKVMERGFALLAEPGQIERLEVEIETAFPGPGARDAFEMVTRAVTGSRFKLDPTLGSPDILGGKNWRYFFRLRYRGGEADMSIRSGHVRPEFLELGAKKDRTPAEEERLTWLKQEMADRLMPLPAAEVYDGVYRRL